MIKSKKDCQDYMEADRAANHKTGKRPKIIGDYTWKYLRYMRKLEYLQNSGNTDLLNKILFLWNMFFFKRLSLQTGIQIPLNTFGKGLALFHWGSIIVNSTARFGDYCVIQGGVNVAENVMGGNEIYIAPGAKINVNVHIPDHVIIGSNAVVTRDIESAGITVGGGTG